MKIGIYISGLGQSFVEETLEKYAERFMNEMSFDTNAIEYELKTEKISYGTQESTVVSIFEKNMGGTVLYKFYDFKYHHILTERFNSHSLIIRSFQLFLLVLQKFPVLLFRIFSHSSYSRPFQTFYLFIIFFILSFAILLMLPSLLDIVSNSQLIKAVVLFKNKIYPHDVPYIHQEGFINTLQTISKITVSFTAILILIIPNVNLLISNLASEFVCANDYIQHGAQKQVLQGNLELLVNYITENEENSRIHFHSYSFGSLLAIDYIYPFGHKVSRNAEMYCEAFVTIGTPFEFVNSYYPLYYESRQADLGDKLHWLNVYSSADALATNFRKDSKIGEAQFGIMKTSKKPTNINYEVAALDKYNLLNFILLYSMRVHGMYWDHKTEGKSCISLVFSEMKRRNLL
ncbi:hypothetical protein P0M11_10335 [Kaistella sp. PBT33-4]|uniref:hypothetical protein n=1 Tax=Kaistella sp. PBT33-4 TaxID=3032000 RepID=UPI0023D81E43|nr:hypothetical protein [Kaistella sp. PBT33-4]MDF0720393.1 hypothetical protein [Kaistella sp. PBT33-4]